MVQKFRSLVKTGVRTGVTRIPAEAERRFFFYLTIVAVLIYLASRFLAA